MILSEINDADNFSRRGPMSSSDPVALLTSRFFKYFSRFSFVRQGIENSVSFGTCSSQFF